MLDRSGEDRPHAQMLHQALEEVEEEDVLRPLLARGRRPRIQVKRWLERPRALVCVALALHLAACSQGAIPTLPATTRTPMTEHPSVSLPTFTDWRIAYLASDTRLHVVAPDGTRSVVGPRLEGFATNGLTLVSPKVSPDGHLLAYEGAAGMTVVDLTGRQATGGVPKISGIYDLAWSPDGGRLALGDGTGGMGILRLSDATYTPIPEARAQGAEVMLGWLDNSHLAVTASHASHPLALASLDLASHQLRALASFDSATLGATRFELSPDGKKALLYNRRFRNDPYTQTVEEIDTVTGAVTPLPHLAQVMGPYSGFTSFAWRAGTQTAAASTGYAVNGDLKTWILDMQHDSAVQMPNGAYAVGWVPDSGSLILSSGEQSMIGAGPFEISAATVSPDGKASTTILAADVRTFPWLGLVRTA